MARFLFSIVCCLSFCLMPVFAHARPDDTGEPLPSVRYFYISAQPLAGALTLFSEQSGRAVLVDSRLTAGKTSTAVAGELTPDAALAALLRGTGLQVRYARNRSFTLVEEEKPPRGSPAAAAGDLSAPGLGGNRFGAVLQRELRAALCADRLTRPGDYRAVIQIWISARGEVSRLRLLNSTGLPSRDRAIVAAVRNMRLRSGIPHALPQPITVLFLPEDHFGRECLNAGG
ncbi:TonB family protein [Brenneria populi subsp. brevivirga]|uniref:TonB family protein n=1 Tax=Brenneria populi TaxID=1505588 RepID=UPI002E1987A0|nr:TonB family protein [Brenneria populi subsp. brevivirga]